MYKLSANKQQIYWNLETGSKRIRFAILILSFTLFASCQSRTESSNESAKNVFDNSSVLDSACEMRIDSLVNLVTQLKAEINSITHDNPFVQIQSKESSIGPINHFKPVGLTMKLYDSRPEFNKSRFFCVPAAFTSPIQTIDGYFLIEGRAINENLKSDISGYIIFSKDLCIIDSIENLTVDRFKWAQKQGYSLFQQELLVKKSKYVKCYKFENHKNIRRAIVKYPEGELFIVESIRPITILEFQQALIEIKVEDAIYLDMATYGEGWYKSCDHEKIRIGELFTNTQKQSNWLTFERTAQ